MHRRGIDIERYPFGRQDRRATCYRDAVPTAPGVHGSSARPTTTWRCWACPRQARDMAREIRIARRAACSRRSPAWGVPCLGGCRWRCPPAPVFYLRVISNQSVKSQNRADGWLLGRSSSPPATIWLRRIQVERAQRHRRPQPPINRPQSVLQSRPLPSSLRRSRPASQPKSLQCGAVACGGNGRAR